MVASVTVSGPSAEIQYPTDSALFPVSNLIIKGFGYTYAYPLLYA